MGSRAACGVEGVGRRFSDMPPAVELIWGLGLKIQGGISLEALVLSDALDLYEKETSPRHLL